MDHDSPDTHSAGHALLRRALTTTGVAAVFLAGLAVGVALPEDTTELDAAGAEAAQARQEVADLELELQDLTEANEQLVASLDEAKRGAASAAALEAREAAVERREARLAKREDHPGRAVGLDRAWANQVVHDIRSDLRTVDRRLRTGSGAGAALSLLSDSYGRLAEAGTPAGVDEADYQARLGTLEALAATAADEYLATPTEAADRYAVVREETARLFDVLDTALGTRFRLP